MPHQVHKQPWCDVPYRKGTCGDQDLTLPTELASELPCPATAFSVAKSSIFHPAWGADHKVWQAQKMNFALRTGLFAIVKSVFDRIIAVFALMVCALPMATIAALIKLDSPGPVFFRQSRVGLHGRVFRIWKFRTMYDARADIHGFKLTERDDARVTAVGGWLRKWSLDEVPQLFNVLSGDMSLVGPRPHALHANIGGCPYADIVPGYYRRHVVKPGITGWAQVRGWRGETVLPFQIEQRVAHDLEYVRQSSLLFDLKIMLLTLSRLTNTDVF
jgi:lipopolysaccharide/colanic/teichoic acid biosynthesis glycosyltransferase